MLRRTTQLKAKKRINPISVDKVEEINSQVGVRRKLCRRAGGFPVERMTKIKINGIYYEVHIVRCHGGECEICHKPQSALEPHEDPPRSTFGKVSMEDSKMVCRDCHNKQKGQPQLEWIK